MEDDENFLQKILWTDESHFHLNGCVNSWNFRIWSSVNPEEIQEQPLWSPKLTLWMGFTASFALKPFFFEENGVTVSVTGERYRHMLESHVIPQLKTRRKFSTTWYQQDGATPHTANLTKNLLMQHFNERVISYGCDFSWPPRSPDINGCDFWLWGYLKANVYHPTPVSLVQLKERICRAIENIPQEMLQAVVDSARERFSVCLSENGGHLFPNYN